MEFFCNKLCCCQQPTTINITKSNISCKCCIYGRDSTDGSKKVICFPFCSKKNKKCKQGTETKNYKMLAKIYLDPAHHASFSSVYRLYKSAKKQLPKLTLKQVKDWLSTQDFYTLHKKLRLRFLRRKTLVPKAHYLL